MSNKEAKKYLDDLAKTKRASKIIIGKYCKRSFDINNCGGKILNLVWKDAKITKKGIEIIRKHLSRFEEITANTKMIERLEKIQKGHVEITDWDRKFFTHETREYERYKNIGFENTKNDLIPEEVYNNAHSATLEDYKLHEFDNGGRSLYHPDIKEIDYLSQSDREILGR
ncbi:MAG TPA: hypothetical protein VF602_07720 [Pedobacter sp.]|jgi:hypothetical protein